jgi:polyhydroxyalkanoate synthesis regulator phasin
MNGSNIGKEIEKLLQKSFYVTLGATASLIEVVQDSQKRAAATASLGQDISRWTQDLVDKGVITEVEARSFVDRFVSQNMQSKSAAPDSDFRTVNTRATTDSENPQAQADLKELTDQLADLRSELEGLRK